MMNILVLNAGSSSLKFQILALDRDLVAAHDGRRLAHGQVERIGPQARLNFESEQGGKLSQETSVADMKAAMERALDWMQSSDSRIDSVTKLSDIHAVGHRVVHGGERFHASVVITDQVVADIEAAAELAPLHNGPNLKGVEAARQVFGEGTPQVAVFDTAFHQTLPEQAFLYALPHELYRKYAIRRYGFHGTSHRYLAERYRRLRNLRPEQVNLITLHLGNGCSACAIRGGKSVDTSMGMTPLEGLVMGTRSGDLDPAIPDFLARKEHLDPQAMDKLLNEQSGLLGLSRETNDMRQLERSSEEGQPQARLALNVFAYRARKYIGAYLAAMGGADAIVFAGGIGENSPAMRARILNGLEWLGIPLDGQRNVDQNRKEAMLSPDGARVAVYLIPTNEELMIALDTFALVQAS